jgi:hypothetical protein
LLAAGTSAVIDVHEPGEVASGHIAGSHEAGLPLMRQVQITAGSLVLLGLTLATPETMRPAQVLQAPARQEWGRSMASSSADRGCRCHLGTQN